MQAERGFNVYGIKGDRRKWTDRGTQYDRQTKGMRTEQNRQRQTRENVKRLHTRDGERKIQTSSEERYSAGLR